MAKKILLCLFLFSVIFSPSCITVLKHNQDKAAAEAEKFANLAFIQNDFQSAYNILVDEAKTSMSVNEFTSFIEGLHPNGYPSNVSAVEYEPIPGQPAMNIYLHGQDTKETYYYRFVMLGTEAKGYKVTGIYRSNTEPPASTLRKPLTENQ